MSALLIYSNRCNHSKDIINFINQHTQLKQLVHFHDVNRLGIPPQYANKINRVPTMLTKNGKLLVGSEVKQWLQSLLPNNITNCPLGGSGIGSWSLDGEDDDDSIFNLNNYGQSLQPAITPDLQQKINQQVGEAFNQNKR